MIRRLLIILFIWGICQNALGQKWVFEREINTDSVVTTMRNENYQKQIKIDDHYFIDKNFESFEYNFEVLEAKFLGCFFHKNEGMHDSFDVSWNYQMHQTLNNMVLSYSVFPLQNRNDSIFCVSKYKILIRAERAKKDISKSTSIANSSVLSTGQWKKFRTNKGGMHKITYSQLSEWGFSTPSNVLIYGNGGKMLPKMNADFYPDDLMLNKSIHSVDGNGDQCIFFYVDGTEAWKYNSTDEMFFHDKNLYSDYVYYYLTENSSIDSMPEEEETTAGTPEVVLDYFTECDFVEKEKFNFLQSGRMWYGDKLNPGENFYIDFNLDGFVEDREVKLKTSVLGRAGKETELKFYEGVSPIDIFEFSKVTLDNEYVDYASVRSGIYQIPADDALRFRYFYNTSEGNATAWIDYLSINYKKQLVLNDAFVLFRSETALDYVNLGYRIGGVNENTIIWDVSTCYNPKKIQMSFNGSVGSFSAIGGEIREYVAFNPKASGFHSLSYVKDVENQDLHSLPGYEMIIVTHPDFLQQAQDLAEFHRIEDEMKVLAVTTDQVYNEFSSGLPDPSAIRNLFRYFYRKGENDGEIPLKYALLFGDGSYDNKNFNGEKNNFIPTYQTQSSLNALSSFVSDDFYGLLDDGEGEYHGYIDIGIGRLPCKNKMEADLMLSKIYNYTSKEAIGDWRNSVCFIADDEDSNSHLKDAEKLANSVEENYPGFQIKKIYFDAYKQVSTPAGERYPDVTEAINRTVEEGVLILNYVGHANSKSLSKENVLEISNIENWNNFNHLPIFVTATCEFGRFDHDNTSAGEAVILNPTGGGIGLFTTTRVVFSYSNYVLNNNFYKYVFEQDGEGRNLRMGDIIRLAKNSTISDTNKRSFTLLADPALRLSYPKYKVQTLSINNTPVNEEVMMIGAMEKVSIEGEVIDHRGDRVTNFNGLIKPVVFDKALSVRTLANDGGYTTTFDVFDNIIYQGLSSIKNGSFSYEFIVPKDISYQLGNGKIYYYLDDGELDGHGAFSDFQIGGSFSSGLTDNLAPEVDLYMNNTDFKNGDEVGVNSILLAHLFDENGINTVGTGIGHDITAYLDDNVGDIFVLNDYYQAAVDDYQSGVVSFPFYDLEPGEHSITVKVWDVFNNSSTSKINFLVKDEFIISDIRNVPNPVETYTDFEIIHNLPGETFNVDLKIFTTGGTMINRTNTNVSGAGSSLLKLRWNINSSNISIQKNQMLLYDITLTTKNGNYSRGSGKMFMGVNNN